VIVFCPCGTRKQSKVCGASITLPNVALTMECDDSCLIKQRQAKMAEAFQIGPNAATLVFPTAWPEPLVKMALHFKPLVLSTEAKLAEMLENPSEKFYYFPRQRLASSSKIICDMCNFYGFVGEIVDTSHPDKANVIVRRTPLRIPTAPRTLLRYETCNSSKVLEIYDPENVNDCDSIEVEVEPVESVESTIMAAEYIPDSVLIRGVFDHVSSDTIIEALTIGYKSLGIKGRLFWLSDSEFYCSFDLSRSDEENTFDGIFNLTAGTLNMLSEFIQLEMVNELKLATSALTCQVVKNAYLRTVSEGLRNIKKRQVSEIRWRGYVDDGWTTSSVFKHQGVVIN
jgi:hypothetical protein